MSRSHPPLVFILLLFAMVVVVGCGTSGATTPQPSPPDAPSVTTEATSLSEAPPAEPSLTTGATTAAATLPAESTTKPLPVATETSVPVSAIATTTLPASAALASPPPADDPDYLDDRSNAAMVMASWANALNRQEYVRVYSYWQVGAAGLASFEEFAAGYAETESVKLMTGRVSYEGAAGSHFEVIPVTVEVRTTSSANQLFVGCYVLRRSGPGAEVAGAQPLGIMSAFVVEVPVGTNTATRMTTICEEGEFSYFPPDQPLPTPDPTDISSQNYLDDRSDPVAVLRSLFNAVNTRQYGRAYSYWEPGAVGLPTFEAFRDGYEQTEAVQLATGDVVSNAGAGQLYYDVPVTLTAENSDSSTQIYVGCYRLHLAQPGIQATPPFRPMAISSATVTETNATDAAAQMATACQ